MIQQRVPTFSRSGFFHYSVNKPSLLPLDAGIRVTFLLVDSEFAPALVTLGVDVTSDLAVRVTRLSKTDEEMSSRQ